MVGMHIEEQPLHAAGQQAGCRLHGNAACPHHHHGQYNGGINCSDPVELHVSLSW